MEDEIKNVKIRASGQQALDWLSKKTGIKKQDLLTRIVITAKERYIIQQKTKQDTFGF